MGFDDPAGGSGNEPERTAVLELLVLGEDT